MLQRGWNGRTIIKVRLLYPVDEKSEDRAENATTASKDEPSADITTAGTHEKSLRQRMNPLHAKK